MIVAVSSGPGIRAPESAITKDEIKIVNIVINLASISLTVMNSFEVKHDNGHAVKTAFPVGCVAFRDFCYISGTERVVGSKDTYDQGAFEIQSDPCQESRNGCARASSTVIVCDQSAEGAGG